MYTKGEWKAESTNGYYWIHNLVTDSIIGGIAKVNPEGKENAYLIAAAPDMYELIKSIRSADLEMSQAMEAEIEIVLRKAEGK